MATMDDLTPTQKSQLQEVADLMLEIYRTLARMRYLSPSWIQAGPHDISSLLPMYQSYNLSSSIIYLYSILPYIDNFGAADVNFFQTSDFADFRMKEYVEQGRDPFYANNEEERMRGWMTPLSMLGNHGSVILYDARKHCVAILDQESCGSSDPNLHEGWTEVNMEDEGEEVTEDIDEGDEGDESKASENDEEEEEEEDDEEEDEMDEDEEEGECVYDEMDSRPAGNVLRDIIKWYRDLTKTPGGGENTGPEWDAELVKPLYLKHGWPNAKFDGDAFLIDQARAAAAESAKWDSEEPVREVMKFQGWMKDEAAMQKMRAKIAAAGTDDERWLARLELWEAEQSNQRNLKSIRKAEEARDIACPNGQCQKPEELILWEERQLRKDLWSKQYTLEKIQQDAAKMQAGELETVPGIEIRLRHAEEQAAIYEKALKAAQVDAERLCPGRLFDCDVGFRISVGNLKKRMEELTGYIEVAQGEVKLMQEWIGQLPNNADQASHAAEAALKAKEKYIEVYKEQNGYVALALEKALAEK